MSVLPWPIPQPNMYPVTDYGMLLPGTGGAGPIPPMAGPGIPLGSVRGSSVVPYTSTVPATWTPGGPTAGPGIPMGPRLMSPGQLGTGTGGSMVPYSGPVRPGGAGVGGAIPVEEALAAQLAGDASVASRASLFGRTGQALGNLRAAGSTLASGGGFKGAASTLGFQGIKGSLGRMAPGLTLATLGPSAINALPLGNQDSKDFLGNIAAGAGIGAAAGAPFAGVGAGPGALLGATAGLGKSLWEAFGGGDDKPSTSDYKNTLISSAQQLGLDPAQYSTAFDLLAETATDPATGKKLGAEGVASLLANQLLQDAQVQKQQEAVQQQQLQQRAGDQRFALALQSQAQEFFAPYVNNIVSAGQSQGELLKGLADQLPAPYRDVMHNQAQQAIGQSQRLAGAYAAQSAIVPQQFMAQAELKRQSELERLQYQQAVIASQQGGGGGGDYQQLQQQLLNQTG